MHIPQRVHIKNKRREKALIEVKRSLYHGKSLPETYVETHKEKSQNPFVTTNLQEIQSKIILGNSTKPEIP